MPVGGVVPVCGAGGRLACAVIVTSGFVVDQPPRSSSAKLLSEPMLRKFRENSEEGYDDDRTGNSAGDRTHPGSSRRDRGRTRGPGRREGEGPGQGRRDEGQGGPDEGPGAGHGHRDVRATAPEPASTASASTGPVGPESAGPG